MRCDACGAVRRCGRILIQMRLTSTQHDNQNIIVVFLYVAGYDLIEWLMERLSIEESGMKFMHAQE